MPKRITSNTDIDCPACKYGKLDRTSWGKNISGEEIDRVTCSGCGYAIIIKRITENEKLQNRMLGLSEILTVH